MITDAIQIQTDPDPYAAFNIAQAYRVGDLVFLSGQAALDLEGNLVGVGDFDAQAEQAFENLRAVLDAAGSSMDKLVKVTIYLTDMSNFGKIVALRERYFSPPWPADTLVEVSALALPELMIEIEGIALIEGQVTAG
ncbi:RidA family protein [Candidatus Litorirhabdus singularis]|uniref:RidA family protein n=1 Tax=Candidatus Litorirhabdus singularis TaxID=2518993 RepID=UPI00242A50D0|nr:RidA family protein [Candidatus Litorirhabdus singularis]